jgi:hypothetical protein
MKIVQTFWTGTLQQHPLHNTGGWLSAEYHWQSWALSVLQLRQFYDEVELVTDAAGKAILIDVLNLPYTSVQVVLDEALSAYPHDLWALAKIYAYSIQTEPFIHIDGDVYIWKRFESHIEQALLVAQNFEVDFPFYQAPLRTVQAYFDNVPKSMTAELESQSQIFSCNTGVIGGQDLSIFQEYKNYAFGFIDSNINNLSKVETKHFNICFEQFLYYCLAKEKGVALHYVIDNQGQFDPTYPGFANFHKVPFDDWYIHCMAEYKRQEVVVQHLSKRLRQDYPSYYYHILRTCQAANLPLHNKVYNLPELSPTEHDDAYFVGLGAIKLPMKTQATDNKNQLYFYAKDVAAYKAVEVLFSLPFEQRLTQQIVLSPDLTIIETTEPVLSQTAQFINLQTLQYDERSLDNLDMILYDAFSETKTINQAIEDVGQYFPREELEADYRKFQDLVLDRIKTGLYLGLLAVRTQIKQESKYL